MSAKGATLRGSDIVDLDFDDLTDLSAPRVNKSALKDAVRSKPRMDLDASDVDFDERMASYKKPVAAPPVIPVAKTKSQSFVGKPAPTPAPGSKRYTATPTAARPCHCRLAWPATPWPPRWLRNAVCWPNA